MSDIPADLHYTSDHEWVRANGSLLTVGITAYAADALGDVVYVDHPGGGLECDRRRHCRRGGSTKSVGEIFAPVSGTVTETNQAVVDDPELINRDPYGEGWLFTVETTEQPELMDADAYRALIGE